MKKVSELRTVPSALRREDAASHCSVSASYFDKMVEEGVMPRPRQMGDGVKLWLRSDLENALFALPEVEMSAPTNPCDRLFA